MNIDAEAIADEERLLADGQKWILKKQSVSPLNINQIFDACGVPESPAACVVDVDGMDYWCILAILQKRQPSLLICEYNCHYTSIFTRMALVFRSLLRLSDFNYADS